MKKKETLLLAFNQVAQFDRVMYDVLDALMDLSDLKKLPQVCCVFPSAPARSWDIALARLAQWVSAKASESWQASTE